MKLPSPRRFAAVLLFAGAGFTVLLLLACLWSASKPSPASDGARASFPSHDSPAPSAAAPPGTTLPPFAPRIAPPPAGVAGERGGSATDKVFGAASNAPSDGAGLAPPSPGQSR